VILDIRGTNGSGKSYPIHQMLKLYGNEQWTLQSTIEDVPFTVVPDLQTAIIGHYDTQCGGADGITKQDAITEAIRALYPKYKTVIVEGSIVASVYARWEALARELDDDYWFWFLETPVADCIASVLERRKAKNNSKPFDPNQTLIPRHEAILRLKKRLIDAGRNVANFDRDTIVNAVVNQAKENAGL